MAEEKTYKFGWIPDYPDFRDYSEENDAIKPLLEKTSVTGGGTLPNPSVDLRAGMGFSEIEHQKNLNSCTANAAAGIIEYFERRAFGKHIDASRLFIYKTTRKLMHFPGDNGASIRATMGALVLFGAPPEEHWPYTDKKPDYDEEPSAFCYAYAQNYQAIRYLSLDHSGIARDTLLSKIKIYLASKIPLMFGFTVLSSLTQAERNSGKIPFPCQGEAIESGHAVVAVGYDDEIKITNTICGLETTGALCIRNSWGTEWGDKGYGWLPYEYVLKGAAGDFWVLLSQEWVDTGQFKIEE